MFPPTVHNLAGQIPVKLYVSEDLKSLQTPGAFWKLYRPSKQVGYMVIKTGDNVFALSVLRITSRGRIALADAVVIT